MTAKEVIQKMKDNLGIPWQENSIRDVFKVGNPDVQVKGIASTCMATVELLKRAQAAGLNMVITHEPTFWSDQEKADLSADPIYRFKSEYCLKNDMVVHRFHDNVHARKPDMIIVGVMRVLGFDQYSPSGSTNFTIPETTLEELASRLRTKLKAHAFRVTGDPKAKVSRLAFSVGGGAGRFSDTVDVAFTGEGQEVGGSDPTGYALDAASLGIVKGFIHIGHIASEEPGMEDVANWLKTFLPNLPIQFMPAHELFWDLG